jgi:hypothetical protein
VSQAGRVSEWFTHASLIWSTSTSYDHKRDFQISKSNIIVRISLGQYFLKAIASGHRRPKRFTLQQSNGLGILFKSTREQGV